jgi:K+-sensing histidine kinase KdpD
VVNAINNSNNGEISLNYVSSSTGYKIVVKDSGMGMSESMVQYLIHGKAKDEVEQMPKYKKGNGVGFQIIRNIIKLMNATIEIDSIENVGTSVSISFVE